MSALHSLSRPMPSTSIPPGAWRRSGSATAPRRERGRMSGGRLISRVRMLGSVCEAGDAELPARLRDLQPPGDRAADAVETIRIGPVTVAPMLARFDHLGVARRQRIVHLRAALGRHAGEVDEAAAADPAAVGAVPAKLASCSREPEKRPRARTLRMSLPVSALCTRSASPASEPRTCGCRASR
jgi:hypothetical protein